MALLADAQTFADATRAPTRHSWAPLGALFAGANFELGLGTYATVDAAFQCYLLTMVEGAQRNKQLEPALWRA